MPINEPFQQMSADIRLSPQARQQLLRLLTPIEVNVDENEPAGDMFARLNELEKQLQIERDKNKEKTFSIFGQWQAGLQINSSNMFI